MAAASGKFPLLKNRTKTRGKFRRSNAGGFFGFKADNLDDITHRVIVTVIP